MNVKNIKAFTITAIIFTFIGAGGMYYFMRPKTTGVQAVTTQHISGAEITHRDFTYGGDAVRFRTDAKGEGSISTSIPKSNIPEAAMWMNAVHGLQASVAYQYGYAERKWYPSYSAMYLHRFGRLQIGAGPVFSQYSVGAQAAASWWF